jgi:hypothetical protein
MGRCSLNRQNCCSFRPVPTDTLHLETEGEYITLRLVRQNVMLKKELGVWVYQGEATDTSLTDLLDRERQYRLRQVIE